MNGTAKSRTGLEHETAYSLYRISRLLRHDLILFLQKGNTKITPEQYFLLFRMAQLGACPQKDLADPALQDHPNVTRLLDGLEGLGLVRRRRSKTDRRATFVDLTARGVEAVRSLRRRVSRERHRAFAGLSPDQLVKLDRTIGMIQNNLERRLEGSQESSGASNGNDSNSSYQNSNDT